MTTLRTRIKSVDFWPPVWPSRFLADPDALTLWRKRSHPVALLYSQQLRAGAPIPANTYWVRFLAVADRALEESGASQLRQGRRSPVPYGFGLPEHGTVPVPDALLDMVGGYDDRHATLVLLHQHMLLLGQDLDWPVEPLNAARDHCLEKGLELRYCGPRKSSPDRRHRAWAEIEHDFAGDAWLTVFVQSRGGETRALEPRFDACSEDDRLAQRALRSLRWLDRELLAVMPWTDDLSPRGTDWVDKVRTLRL